jgi:hypothetical protein
MKVVFRDANFLFGGWDNATRSWNGVVGQVGDAVTEEVVAALTGQVGVAVKGQVGTAIRGQEDTDSILLQRCCFRGR